MRNTICNYIVLLGYALILLISDGQSAQSNVKVEKVTESYGLTEGPHWDHRTQKLYFVDIVNQRIYRLDTATGGITSAYIENGTVGVVVPVYDTTDKLAAGVGRDLVLVTWDGENNETVSSTQLLCHVDTDNTETRINDGKVDSFGRFWFGTMAKEVNGQISANQGSLYRVDDKLKPIKEISPVSISNGLAWNIEDDTFYYIDSPTHQITAYNYDPHTGAISNKRIILDLNETDLKGLPDGMAIDTEGNLWIALYGGSCVIHVNSKTGKILHKIDIPAVHVTSVAFGGPLLDILYVTTASHSLSAEQRKANPQAGAIFAVKNLGVRGILPNTFKMNEELDD